MTMLGRGRGKSNNSEKSDKTEKSDKAKRAEEAARRAEELAEQARLAAEEAKAARREAAAESDETDLAEPAVEADADAETDTDRDGTGMIDSADDADDLDDDDDDGDLERVPRRVRAGAGMLVALGLVAAAPAGLVGYFVTESRELDAIEKARKQAGYAATQAAQDISSYDYRTLESDLKRAAGHTTGKFRSEFEATIPRVRTAAQQTRTVVEGTAIKTGIEEASPDRVIVLVYLNQQTAKTADGEKLPTQFRLRMTMVKTGGSWLVEKLETV